MPIPDPSERSLSFQPGQSFGKFYLVQLIGVGGTSSIFKALQQPISRLVALKIPTFPDGGGVLTPDEFLAEATLMARLDHPNIARIHDFGVEEGRAFISMEYVDGWNLLELVSRRHPLSPAAVLAIASQTLDALLHAHSHDVLHQDLSPANVLVTRQGTVKLIDFGMAGKRAPGQDGSVVGTPAFLSPEHVAGEPATARSDLFCFGSLLYFVIRGEPLFDTGDGNSRLREAFQAIEKARWQPPHAKLRSLPSPLANLVRSALEGGDPEALLREIRESYAQAEGGTPPDAALRRELLDEGNRTADGDPVSEKEIREAYLRLRADGRHREAVALLERSLRRFPDNPALKDLLSTPPARAKSAPVTVEVSSGPGGRRAGRKLAIRTAWTAGLAAGAMGLALFAYISPRMSEGQASPSPAGKDAPASAAPDPTAGSGAAGREILPPPASPPEAASPDAGGGKGNTKASQGKAAGRAGAGPGLLKRVSASAPEDPRPLREARRRDVRLPPALSVTGPAGSRILVNDTLDLVAPSPGGGWTLPAGLVNLVVTRPGDARSISSSLFVAADTLYQLRLLEDGGFTVSRRPR